MSHSKEVFPRVCRQDLEHVDSQAEWWYFDAISTDGWSVIMIFYSHLGNNDPTFSLFLNDPDNRGYSHHEVSKDPFLSSEVQYLQLSNHKVDKRGGIFEVNCRTDKVQVELSFEPAVYANTVDILDPRMFWRIEVPKAKVLGKISIDGIDTPFNGEGYHDHNWFSGYDIKVDGNNREVLATLLKGWQFGRFFDNRLGCIYGFNENESHILTFKDGLLIDSSKCQTIQSKRKVLNKRLGCSYPSEITFKTDNFTVITRPMKIMSENILINSTCDKDRASYMRFLNQTELECGGIKEVASGLHEIWS